ncbi:MAG: deoxyribodipyrimidine photo-lyase [Chromatiaceae bacterium]|nr:deoxyribodipyrimidine photo-lyase [Chromatiaceae bacterium]MBP8289150.1 deoxyribodipyrimidine photo-lyase [Chromatiaceae bacterium]
MLESLRELARALKNLGGRLHVRSGEVAEVLTQLHALSPLPVQPPASGGGQLSDP